MIYTICGEMKIYLFKHFVLWLFTVFTSIHKCAFLYLILIFFVCSFSQGFNSAFFLLFGCALVCLPYSSTHFSRIFIHTKWLSNNVTMKSSKTIGCYSSFISLEFHRSHGILVSSFLCCFFPLLLLLLFLLLLCE